MARIIDLDKVKAGAAPSGIDSDTQVPVPMGTDSSCGTDWVCEGVDNTCVIDHACKYGPDAACTIDYTCGMGGHDEAACLLSDQGC